LYVIEVLPVALPLTFTVQYVRLLGPYVIEVGEHETVTVGVIMVAVSGTVAD
jgi:hypothetical protein